ncbi:mannitol dehydrogenase family protein [Planktotalea arctica]|uniref:mannitol dehydrogenase family protein n=1 Tax=Planktotalea arctica TaxID=1481893 RepID=UPI000A1729B9|nr:mannitol dehydrogenase family protein [Planktotalea arctica]
MDELTKEQAIALSDVALAQLPTAIKRPRYDRSKLTAGIVHIGLGNFHRAHQAWYLHRLMEQGLAHDWAILGAGVRAGDSVMRDKLLAQDCLTTLIELDPAGVSAEVIGSMIGFVPIEDDNASLIKAMCEPAIRIVGLTVTEGGYFRDASGALDLSHADIVHDAANPDKPRTAFGAMIAALKLRRANGHAPFTGLCCDNLQGNGEILRQTVVGLARLSDPALADWIDQNASFPDAMVDCIVPATGAAELEVARALGVNDAAPVTHENFRQWVIEDNFCNGRPPWEQAGATLTDNVHPFESMKIRILNAGHQLLANVGEVNGLETIADCMGDAQIAAFFRKAQTEAILPNVDAVPGMSPERYLGLIESRFANPKIRDTTRRVAFDGSSRHPGFILPVLREAMDNGSSYEGLALAQALWARMCAGTREDGSVIAPNDPHWDALVQAAEAARVDPSAWLAQTQFYGDLGCSPEFLESFAKWLELIWDKGSRAAIDAYLA